MKRPKNKRYRVLVVYNQSGQLPQSAVDSISEEAVSQEVSAVTEAAREAGHTVAIFELENIVTDVPKIRRRRPDVIFNFCEGYRGSSRNEMHVAGIWEMLGIPYTGNPALTLGFAQNKVLSKQIFESRKISTPPYEVYTSEPRRSSLKYPLIAKPASEDASLGISHDAVVHNLEELQEKVQFLLRLYHQPVLVEKYIEGREFNIGILGNYPPKALPVSEIDFSALRKGEPHITSYEAKWIESHPMYRRTPSVCPAPIRSELRTKLKNVALQVYRLLNGRDYGRIDVRVNSAGKIFVLEYNPNPDISPDAGYAKGLKAAGIPYAEFVNLLIDLAYQRRPRD
ncbi:ATP-grasp domain-containing protein [bacterium]|nr:ATP-grasp domain-containing protein [bacterium]